MAPQRWTDEMLDRQADQIAETRAQQAEARAQLAEMRSQLVETRAQQAEDRTRLAETRDRIDALIEAQQMLVQIYQQEHEARVEADRRFNRFIEEQQQINQEQKQINARLAALLEELQQMIRFSRDNGNPN